jgi:hypothetical protein
LVHHQNHHQKYIYHHQITIKITMKITIKITIFLVAPPGLIYLPRSPTSKAVMPKRGRSGSKVTEV